VQRIKQTVLLLGVLTFSVALAAPAKVNIKGGKVGVVDVQTVIGSLNGSASFVALNKKANADLATRAKTIQALQVKARSLNFSAADRQALAKAQADYQAAAKNYGAQQQKAFGPLATKVNAAVATAAKAQGYTVVFDKRKAAGGLVIYANAQSTDLTAAVQKVLKK
jgi:outer membrane protein